jgi:amino acid transporter
MYVLTARYSRFLARVNKTTHTPVNSVWFVVFFSAVLNLIAIGSTETASAIFNITAPALDISYISVILAHQIYRHRVKFIEGPFTLGRWGRPINLISIIWVIFVSVVLFFPPTRPVTATNMWVVTLRYQSQVNSCFNRNYAICVAAFIAIFSLSWWWLSARR